MSQSSPLRRSSTSNKQLQQQQQQEILSQTNSESSTSLSQFTNNEITLEKYQRLANEYAKIRAQLIKLKKTKIDDDTKYVEQQQQIKSNEQNIRRMKQEIECLQFHNQQLQKRIQMLQNDLNNNEHNNKNNQHSRRFLSFSSSPSSSKETTNQNQQQMIKEYEELIQELNSELKSKNEQLELLKQAKNESEQENLSKIEHLEHQLKNMDLNKLNEIENYEKQLQELRTNYNRLLNEKNELKNRYDKIEKEFNDIKVLMENLKYENKHQKQRVSALEQQLFAINKSSNNAYDDVGDAKSVNKQKLINQALCNNDNIIDNNYFDDLKNCKKFIDNFMLNYIKFLYTLSTLHSNISQKISIMFALFHKQSNHLYFIDYSKSNDNGDNCIAESKMLKDMNNRSSTNSNINSDNDSNLNQSANDQNQNNLMPYRSMSVMSALRKFRDYTLQSSYDTYLVQLEDSSKQFLELKSKQWDYQSMMNNHDDDRDEFENLSKEIDRIDKELSILSNDIIETLVDYVNYLNRINFYLTICLNLWCKQYQNYDPENLMIKNLLNKNLQKNLSDKQNCQNLLKQNESLIQSITASIQLFGQICTYLQLLLLSSSSSSSLSKQKSENYSKLFNNFLQNVREFEICINEMKQIFNSKIKLEHDLEITLELELKSIDKQLISTFNEFSDCVKQLRLLFEMNQLFFVGCNNINNEDSNYHQSKQLSSKLINGDNELKMPIIENTIDNNNNNDNECKLNEQSLSSDLKLKNEKLTLEVNEMKLKLIKEQNRFNELEQKYQSLLIENQPKPDSNKNIDDDDNGDHDNNHDHGVFAEFATLNRSTINSEASPQKTVTNNDIEPMINKDNDGKNNDKKSLSSSSSSSNIAQSTNNDHNDDKNLINKIEYLNSNLRTFEHNCSSLRQRLLFEQNNVKNLEKIINEKQLKIDAIESELQSIKENYEQQLQAMSEHMAKLNETITNQYEQIELLRFNHNNNNNNQQQQPEQKNQSFLKKSSTTSLTNLRKGFGSKRSNTTNQ